MDTRRRPDGALPKSIPVERAKRVVVAFHITTLGTSRVLVTLLAVGLGRAGWSPQGSSVPHVRLGSVQLKGLVLPVKQTLGRMGHGSVYFVPSIQNLYQQPEAKGWWRLWPKLEKRFVTHLCLCGFLKGRTSMISAVRWEWSCLLHGTIGQIK